MGLKNNIKYWIQRRTRGWSDDECWNIEYEFVIWLNEHLKVYLRDASKIVDLDYNHFEYNGKTYTQRQLINKLIKLSDYIKNNIYNLDRNTAKKLDKSKDEMLDIFKLIYWTLWW